MEIAKIERNGNFSLSNIKFVVNQFNYHYPLFYKLLKFSITIPSQSVKCEKSISALRRIYNYSRKTIRLNRLGNMSLLFFESELIESIDNIHGIDYFSTLKSQKFALNWTLLRFFRLRAPLALFKNVKNYWIILIA